MDYQSRNDARSEKGFAKILRKKDEQTKKAMVKCMKKAYEYAMNLHEHTHHNLHLIMGGDYGWALVHNGVIEEKFLSTGKNDRGTADAKLESLALKVGNKGWVGILMAGMEAGNYHTNFERGVLRADAEMTATEFQKHFKKFKLV